MPAQEEVEARGTILAGGVALIGGAVAFIGVFSYLAARFHYPEVLDGNARDVLSALLATGASGRAAWALYAVLPLVFIPAGVSAFEALRKRAAGPMRVGALFAFLSACVPHRGIVSDYRDGVGLLLSVALNRPYDMHHEP